jgi:hypothetical protein
VQHTQFFLWRPTMHHTCGCRKLYIINICNIRGSALSLFSFSIKNSKEVGN